MPGAPATEDLQIATNALLAEIVAAIGTTNGHLAAIHASVEAHRADAVAATEEVAAKVEQQRVDLKASTDAVAAKVEEQRIDTLAATEAVRDAVEEQRLAVVAATETARLAQVQALQGLPH